MPSGQLMTMPVLIVNMGGEMVYILDQRLQAQKIPEAKGQKVLNDVVRTMYYPRFVDELFKPQEMYSIQSTRQIFDRLAHSSSMRLNESSMDKLFDLMAMGFKYQIMSCLAPQEMIDITHNHLDALRRLMDSTPQVAELLDESVARMQAAYGMMSLWDFNVMRQSLCTFFQDRKTKVSLFLHDQTQNGDGSIVVPSRGTLAVGALALGTVRYFAGGAEVGREALPTVHATAWAPGTGVRTALGTNVYEKDRTAPAQGNSGPPPAAAWELPCAGALLQVRAFGGWRRARGATEKNQSSFAPYPMVPYGIKRSAAYRESKKAARRAAERARRAAEEKGMLLDPKKQLRMELKRNSGIGWYRSMQIIKHLEMHERGLGPPIDQAMRDRITEIARVVRMGK